MEKYDTIDEFCKFLNPDVQKYLCKNTEKCIFGDFPTLSMIEKRYKISASYWIVPQLMNLSQYCGCKDKLTGKSLEECAVLIAQNFYFLKTSELMLFFYLFKSGRYGKFYGSVDPLVIMQALWEFMEHRNVIIDRHKQEILYQQREKDKKSAVKMPESILRMINEKKDRK